MTTATSWISKKADRCGGDACVRDTRIPVSLLVEERDLGQSDEQIMKGHPDLTAADLDAAWTYYEENSLEIEQALWKNTACMVDLDGRPVPLDLLREGRELGLTNEEIRDAFYPPLSQAVLETAWQKLGIG